MATYVVGDIHGCFREWIQLKSKIERQDTEAQFILAGDILDKGSHSMEMLKWAMEKIIPGSRYQMVLGNHETEKIEWLKYVFSQPDAEPWRDQRIAWKMLSADGYEFYKICCEKNWDGQQLREVLAWLESIPSVIYKEIESINGAQSFIITHHRPKPGEAVMDLYRMQLGMTGNQKTIVIHGHIPTILEPCKSAGAIPGKIWIQEKEINVDCGMVYGVSKKQGLFGDLAAIRLEDLKEFYYYNHHV